MKYEQARDELQRILEEQQTVSIPKLRRLLQVVNVSFKPGKEPDTQEVAFLKGEIKKLNKRIRRMKKGSGGA